MEGTRWDYYLNSTAYRVRVRLIRCESTPRLAGWDERCYASYTHHDHPGAVSAELSSSQPIGASRGAHYSLD